MLEKWARTKFPLSNMKREIVSIAELPSEDSVVSRDSSYFKNNVGELPTPDTIRQKDIEVNDTRARTPQPPPIPPGDTLEEAWPSLSDDERGSICEQLRGCVGAWRRLRQESAPYYIGNEKRFLLP